MLSVSADGNVSVKSDALSVRSCCPSLSFSEPSDLEVSLLFSFTLSLVFFLLSFLNWLSVDCVFDEDAKKLMLSDLQHFQTWSKPLLKQLQAHQFLHPEDGLPFLKFLTSGSFPQIHFWPLMQPSGLHEC